MVLRERMKLQEEIDKLEASMCRLDQIDPEEIDPDEYADILVRLVKLREERDATDDLW